MRTILDLELFLIVSMPVAGCHEVKLERPDQYGDTVRGGVLRDTPQRRHVYDLLRTQRDHPTATEVFLRAKKNMPSISLATVYNTLETLVACRLVKQVHVDREPTRFCPNLEEHGHFVCDRCGKVYDIDLAAERSQQWNLPRGFSITHHEVSLRGVCADCADEAKFKTEIE